MIFASVRQLYSASSIIHGQEIMKSEINGPTAFTKNYLIHISNLIHSLQNSFRLNKLARPSTLLSAGDTFNTNHPVPPKLIQVYCPIFL